MLWSQGSQDAPDAEFTALRAESIRQNLMPLFEEDKYRELTTDEEIFLKHYSARNGSYRHVLLKRQKTGSLSVQAGYPRC